MSHPFPNATPSLFRSFVAKIPINRESSKYCTARKTPPPHTHTTRPQLMISFLTLILSLLLSGIHSSRVHRFSIEKTDKLKAALRSGDPWAIGCLGLQKDQDANTNSMLDQLSNALDSGKKFKDLPDKVKVGSVNCKGKLPSGKSLKSKYKLSSQKGIPTFFFVGNGRQPKQLKVTDFTSKDKKDKTKLMLAPTTMARYVTKAAKPTVVELTTDVQLKQNCLKDKSGAIVLLLGRQNGRSKKLSKSPPSSYWRHA